MTRRAMYKFRIYLAGDALNSVHALANLVQLCKTRMPDQHEIEVVDVFREPKRALKDGIFLTPTLVKLAPLPVRRIVGTLSDLPRILQVLELEALEAPVT